ncbi:MAG: transglutaminase N-terminal domain-containing protein, partial [Opitutaceae bacterium]
MPRYQVTHRTAYTHSSFVTAAWQSLHLQPRNEAAQHCESFELLVAPHPADLASRFDYFGNKQHVFT